MASLRISRLPGTLNIICQSKSYTNKCLVFRKLSSYAAKPSSVYKLGLVGASVGALLGAGYSGYYFYTENKTKLHFLNEHIYPKSMISCPDYKPTRQINIPTDKTNLKLVLFQYQTCPFCCKVRAFLDYYGFSYDVVEVDAVLRQSIKWSEYKKVPILVAKGENGYYQLNDSTVIISALGSYLADTEQKFDELVNFYPKVNFTDENGQKKSDIMNKYFLMYQGIPVDKSQEEIMTERQWRMWADSLLVHMLSPNVYRTFEEALQTFNWFSEVGEWRKHFPVWEVTLMVKVGAFAMWMISKRLKTKYNLKDDVRESLYDACDTWVNAIHKKGTPFMGGQYPDLSDLAVFGVLNSFEGCDAFKDVIKNTDIGHWYAGMRQSVNKHLGNQIIREAL